MHRFVLASLALLAAPVLAIHAQTVEVYGMATGLNATNVPTDQYQGVANPGTASNNTSLHYITPTGGVTYNFLRLPVIRVGVDGRGADHLALGGVKAAAKLPFFNVTPYVQGSFGYLNLIHYNQIDNKYTVAEILAGIDIPVLPRISIRALEVGVGHALQTNNNSKPTFITASSGIVVRF